MSQFRFQCSIETCRKMFTTNAALNYHCKSKHNAVTDEDGNERSNNGNDSGIVETLTKSETSQVVAKRGSKRKIPKIVYVMPGNLESESEVQTKQAKNDSPIDIQSITSIPSSLIYIVDQ